MADIVLPRGKTALLVMDCQNDIAHKDGKMAKHLGAKLWQAAAEKNLFETINKVVAAARAANIPIIHVKHAYRPDYMDAPNNAFGQRNKELKISQDGTWGTEIVDELKPMANDIVITKNRESAFYASPLESILSVQGWTHLVLMGIATDGVVEGTAREGSDRGYNIFIVTDGCIGSTDDAHRATIGGILRVMTTVCGSADIIGGLGKSA